MLEDEASPSSLTTLPALWFFPPRFVIFVVENWKCWGLGFQGARVCVCVSEQRLNSCNS